VTAPRALALLLLAAACGEAPAPPATPGAPEAPPPAAFEPPVVTNEDPPVRYPPALFQQNVEGTVTLRLFVDSLGRLRPESTRVAESSGAPLLDSAALAGVRDMRFAAARRNGRPVGTSFLQPVRFRRPDRPPVPGEP